MGILSWIVVGLIAGWLAGMVMKGGGFGLIVDIIVGVVGALLGGWIATTFLNIGPGCLASICNRSWWRSGGQCCCSSYCVYWDVEETKESSSFYKSAYK